MVPRVMAPGLQAVSRAFQSAEARLSNGTLIQASQTQPLGLRLGYRLKQAYRRRTGITMLRAGI